jgi:hypothetical protein
MSIKVEVCSPILPPREDMLDLYRPKLHSFDNGPDGIHPEHIDIVVTWKGLEVSQAREVLFWKQAAKAALESYVEELLIASIDALWAESSKNLEPPLSLLTFPYQSAPRILKPCATSSTRWALRRYMRPWNP